MGEVFLKVLNMSIAASWLILAVMLLRFVLKRAPKWIAVLLWGIVALRLAVPFSFESALSLIPSGETFNAHNIQYETPAISSGIPAINNAVNPVLGETFAPNPATSVNPLYGWTLVVSAIWLFGIAAMLLYAVISYVRVYRSVAERMPYEENIFLCDHVKSPFILGLVRPKIYLPSNMDAMAMEPVIAHEKAHLARRDHWWKPMGFLILTVHWFNPLCWIAYVLLCRDIEQACDEKVIRPMDLDGKKQYSTALLECSTQRRLVTICPLAFGEVGVKERVKNVLNYKKPAFWVIVVAVVACAVVTVCFATNPKQELSQEQHIDELQVKYPEYFELWTSKGLEVYVWQMAESDYRFGLMEGTNREKTPEEKMALKGTTAEEMALILSTYDIEDKSIFVIPWQNPISSYMATEDMAKDPEYINNIRAMLGLDGASMSSTEIDGITTQKLTLDDVVMLSQKGDALTWSDFEQYQGREVGSGLYIMRYDIDKLFDVLVGGVPEETPMYIDLRVHNEAVDSIDIRTEDVSAFIAAHRNDVPKVDGIVDALNKLEYQPYTCDGLPEYQLYAIDGTVYSINFSEKWVWRGNNEQAKLSDELIRQLKESEGLMVGDKPLETQQVTEQTPQIEAQQTLNPIVNIVDRTKTEGLPYDMAEEKFFENGDNEYYLSGIYSHYVIVHYEDGSQEDIVTALNAGRATIADLDKFEVDYIVRPLDTEN